MSQAVGATAANPQRFPGQQYVAASGLHYNLFRDYDPTTGRYLESDPIGLEGGLNTYAYAGANPVTSYDADGRRCVAGVGCWTTAYEHSLANSGNYLGYYKAACAGGDGYACFAGHVAANDDFWGHRATERLRKALQDKADRDKNCIDFDKTLDRIRKALAKDYANYLPSDPAHAQWPDAWDVARIHWDEFANFGLPASTFGGTPLGPGALVIPDVWCPNCTRNVLN